MPRSNNRHSSSRNGNKRRNIHRAAGPWKQDHSPLQRFLATQHRNWRRHPSEWRAVDPQQAAYNAPVGAAHSKPLMHDGESYTRTEAILRHGGEAIIPAGLFRFGLSSLERSQLL